MFELLSYGDAGWGDEILAGLAITMQLAIVTLPIGLLIGFVAAVALANFPEAMSATATLKACGPRHGPFSRLHPSSTRPRLFSSHVSSRPFL